MLQFNSIRCNSTIRNSCSSLWKLTSMLSSNSTAIHPETTPVTNSSKDEVNQIRNTEQNQHDRTSSVKELEKNCANEQNSLMQMIKHAKDVSELLKLTKSPNLNSQHVIAIMSAINRQLKNQSLHDKRNYNILNQKVQSTLVNMIMGKGKVEPEATNIGKGMFSEFSTSAMVQVLKKLSQSKQRNVPLLKELCPYIVTNSSFLSMRTCADILYSLATLNYIDEVLIEKIILNVLNNLPKCEKPSVVGSIMTSIGLLRYKNSKLLDAISEWSNSHFKILRYQDVSAVLQSFATFGYKSKSLDSFLKNHVYSIQEIDIRDIQEWLDIVWSLTTLERATSFHLTSVLQKNFVEQILEISESNISKRLKLLNINGAAQFIVPNYNGPSLEVGSRVFDVPLERGKQRHEIVNTLSETFENIVNTSYFKTNINTDMGFYIDVECLINSENKLQPIDSDSQNTKNKRVAIMIHDYHDYCRGEKTVLGIVNFYIRLLKAKGYKVLTISYLNFSKEDKLEKRIKYLSEQLKSIGISAT